MKVQNLITLIILFFNISLFSQNIQNEDTNKLKGDWKGNLTYMDYSSNKPYSMPCNVSISVKKKGLKLILKFEYPNEPKANGKRKINISKDRSIISNEKIISREKLSDGTIEITTEYSGKDGNDNKSATIRNIYIIGDHTFIMKKKVKFEDSEDWLKRNEFNFTKN